MIQKLIFLIIVIFLTNHVQAHEIFSLRPDIMRTGGLGVDNILKHTQKGSQPETIYTNKLMYGFSEYLTIEIRTPITVEKKALVSFVDKDTGSEVCEVRKNSGIGKIHITGKLRIYKQYKKQVRNQIILSGGVLIPTIKSHDLPLISTGSVDFLFAALGGFETTKWYHFTTFAYRLNTAKHQNRHGDKFFFSYTLGYRPETPQFKKPDMMFLFDFDGIHQERDLIADVHDEDSGGTRLFIGPSFFLSIGNFMLKGGFQVPLVESVNGFQKKHNYRLALGAFVQF